MMVSAIRVTLSLICELRGRKVHFPLVYVALAQRRQPRHRMGADGRDTAASGENVWNRFRGRIKLST